MQIRILVTLVALALPLLGAAQAPMSAEPFKVGTFEINGQASVGIVLRDSLIVDLNGQLIGSVVVLVALIAERRQGYVEIVQRAGEGERGVLVAVTQ